MVYAGACALALAIAVAFSWLTPLNENYRVTVLDVGQGQCVVLQSAGRTYLVDCGGSTGQKSADAAMEYLYSIGIFRIDGMILTHPDADHVNGAALLAGGCPSGRPTALRIRMFSSPSEPKSPLQTAKSRFFQV